MLNKQCKVKLIAASLGLAASLNASAAMGGLQVQSNLDEPFSGTVVVTGDEARALAGSAKPAVIGANLTATVTQQGSDRAVIRLRSSAPMKEPVLTFWLGVGNQNRQYTAMLDPKDYQAPAAQQPARRAVQEVPQASRERAAEPRRQAERERSRPRQAQASGRVEVVRGSHYQVKDGELLVDIAQRVQPSGMTLRQTINALVRANPKSFRNGNPDLMYSGTTLIIPEAAQLRRLAHDSQIRVRAGAGESTAPVAEKEAVAPQQPTTTETQVQSPTQPAAPEPAKPAATETEPAEAPVASEPATAASELPALTASEAAASEAAVSEVSEPVAPPVVEQVPMVETPAEPEPQPDWTQWALYGAGGVVVLGGLAYLLAKRRKKPAVAGVGADAAGDDDEDDLFFEDIGESAAAGKAAPAVTAVADAVKEDDLYLDADQLAAQQHLGNTPDTESVAAASEAAVEEDDWSWLEDQTEEVAVSQADEPAPAAPVAAAAVSSVAAATATAAVVDKSADDWLDFGGEALPAAAPDPVTDPVSEAVADDLAWVWDEDDEAAAQASVPLAGQSVDIPAETAHADADLNFGFTVADDAAPAVAAAEVQVAAEDESLSFDIGMPADEAGRVSATQEAAGFDTAWQPEVSEAEVSALDFSVDANELSFAETPAEVAAVSAFDDHAQDLDFNLNFVDEAEPAVQAAEPLVAESSMPAFDFANQEVSEAEPAQLEAEALDWAESAQQPAALPQEALEAKLELAKMYLEIDDANTARQTLMELVNESNGSSIQAQAQALLQELG